MWRINSSGEMGQDKKVARVAPTIFFARIFKTSVLARMSACETEKKITNRKVFAIRFFNH